MEKPLADGEPEAAQKVAAECVVHAGNQRSLELGIDRTGAEKSKEQAKALKEAYEEVEEEEDEHLYHTQGWLRELSIGSGIARSYTTSRREKGCKTAIGAARAKNEREKMVRGKKSFLMNKAVWSSDTSRYYQSTYLEATRARASSPKLIVLKSTPTIPPRPAP